MKVRRATVLDLMLVDHLRRTEAESLGFLPLVAYQRVIGGERPDWGLWVVEENTEAVGFVFASGGTAGASAHIYQISTRRDARRLDFATALVERVKDWAGKRQRQGLTCRVALDIEARAFWDALGFVVVGTEQGGKRRTRILERRFLRLPCGLFGP